MYPSLDSVIWTSTPLPAVSQVLAFDPEGGTMVFVDDRGRPDRLDLRLNDFRIASKEKLSAITSADGTNIFGINAKQIVVRLNPSGGDWRFHPAGTARAVLAQPDGSVIVATARGAETLVSLVRPPDTVASDTARIPLATRAVRTQVGDRVYLTSEEGLAGLKAKDLSPLKPVAFSSRIRALAPTPSGDRLYVATLREPEVAVVDRYSGKVTTRIPLPGIPSDLRMDALGRYLLARFPAADSAWVIAIGSDKLTGAVASRWTNDLPTVAPDGSIALLGARDVRFVNGETFAETRVARNGAKDFWHFFTWNGFRPRLAGVDQPVNFDQGSPAPSSTVTVSSTPPAVAAPAPARDSTAPPAPAAALAFTLSFATVLNEARARQLASEIIVNGAPARVVQTEQGGVTVYRVVAGPYPTRDEAEKAGRSSSRQFWIFEGMP